MIAISQTGTRYYYLHWIPSESGPIITKYGNVKGENPQSKLEADELDFDLNTKNLKISMYSKERVNIKTKF